MTTMDRIQELKAELEDELGCCVIIWIKDDYPGTEEEKQERFMEHCDSLCDRLIEIGNEAIYNEYGSDDEGES